MSAPSVTSASYTIVPLLFSATDEPVAPDTNTGLDSSTFVIASVTSCSVALPAPSVATTVKL